MFGDATGTVTMADFRIDVSDGDVPSKVWFPYQRKRRGRRLCIVDVFKKLNTVELFHFDGEDGGGYGDFTIDMFPYHR